MKYEQYTAADFVQDLSFQKWILNKDQEAHAFWSKWLHEHPEKEIEVRKAIDLLGTLEFDKDVVANASFIETWKKVERQTIRKKANKNTIWFRAASFALILFSGFFIYWWVTKSNVYSLSAGNVTTTYILPDSSTITLNKNSEIKYSVNNNEGDREVWLKGEAYFEVNKQFKKGSESPSTFTVHTNNADIEVLGTAFNLYQDNNKTQVVLTHGKIKLTSPNAQETYLKPGEFAEINTKIPIVKKKKVNIDLYTSWTQQKISFDKTPLSEIAQWIEDRYAKKVIIPDNLNEVTFSATLPEENLNLLLKALEGAYYVNVVQDHDVITIIER